MDTPYYIVIVSDESYTQHAAVMLCSLFETNPDKIFAIYFFTIDISKEGQQHLSQLCEKYKSTISFIVCPIEKISDLPIGQWNIIMYLKLFMPQLLPTSIERCLFLDVDMIINSDIAKLYHTDLSNNVIAATEDIPDCIKHKQRIGLQQDDLYINSGVMVCDLSKWRIMEQKQPIFDFTHTIASKILNEQDVIALYFKNNIKTLPIRWNMVTFYYMRKPKIFNKYLPQLKEAKRNPGIIHFACPIKPWFRDCNHPFGYTYRRYLEHTPWYMNNSFPFFERLTPRQRFNKYIKNILNKLGILQYADYLMK